MTQEALKLALEALERFEGNKKLWPEAITAIKEALAQTQEPFAYVNVEKRRLEFASPYVKWDTPTTIKLDKIPLYTTPPQRTWVGLTDEEIWDTPDYEETRKMYRFAKAIEAKLKEKNT